MLRIDHAYRFPHDRVQEAAYSLVPESERAALHLEIGRRLWRERRPPSARRGRSRSRPSSTAGRRLIASREERERVAEINLSAGKRAKESAAYASALTYFTAGCALLSEDSWRDRYELTFALELNRAECEHLSGDVDGRRERGSPRCPAARGPSPTSPPSPAPRSRSTRPRTAAPAPSRPPSTTCGRSASNGRHTRRRPRWPRSTRGSGRRSETVPIESLVDLPAVSDPDCRATMDVLLATFSPALITDPNLHDLLVGRIASLSLAHGNSDASCLAYVRLATMLGRRFGDYAKGFRFGKLGFDLVEKHGLLALQGSRVPELRGPRSCRGRNTCRRRSS